MPTHDEKPWWELEGEAPPHDAAFEAEREYRREQRALSWQERLEERDRRRARTSVPPPESPPRAA
jgi:hypothetical protein